MLICSDLNDLSDPIAELQRPEQRKMRTAASSRGGQRAVAISWPRIVLRSASRSLSKCLSHEHFVSRQLRRRLTEFST